MRTRKHLPLLFLSLTSLSWPAYPLGVLTAQASVKPERITPYGNAQITVVASDGFQKPIPMASIKIVTDTGYFEASNQNVVVGYTDQDGAFQAVWHGNLQTRPGPHRFDVTANKNAYVSKYPITATATVIVDGPSGDSPQEGRQALPLLHGQ